MASKLTQGLKYLITTNDWFYAPDGKQYRSVWGELKAENAKDFFGYDIGNQHSKFFIVIDTNDNHVLISGCRVHYAVRCDKRPEQIKDLIKEEDRQTIKKKATLNTPAGPVELIDESTYRVFGNAIYFAE